MLLKYHILLRLLCHFHHKQLRHFFLHLSIHVRLDYIIILDFSKSRTLFHYITTYSYFLLLSQCIAQVVVAPSQSLLCAWLRISITAFPEFIRFSNEITLIRGPHYKIMSLVQGLFFKGNPAFFANCLLSACCFLISSEVNPESSSYILLATKQC